MKKIVNVFGTLLVNVALLSAMTGKSRFIFYEPQIPKELSDMLVCENDTK